MTLANNRREVKKMAMGIWRGGKLLQMRKWEGFSGRNRDIYDLFSLGQCVSERLMPSWLYLGSSAGLSWKVEFHFQAINCLYLKSSPETNCLGLSRPQNELFCFSHQDVDAALILSCLQPTKWTYKCRYASAAKLKKLPSPTLS